MSLLGYCLISTLFQHEIGAVFGFITPEAMITAHMGKTSIQNGSNIFHVMPEHVSCDLSEEDHNVKDSQKDIMNRRALFQKGLTTAASIAFLSTSTTAAFPSSVLAAEGNTLEELKLGKGTWNDPNFRNPSEGKNDLEDTVSIPLSFSNYACRFLIHYDPAVKSLWEEQISNKEQDEALMQDFFLSFMTSVQNAFLQFLSSKQDENNPSAGFEQLAQIFISKYGNINRGDDGQSDSAERHIAILFSLLPVDQQPIDELTKLDAILQTQSQLTQSNKDTATAMKNQLSKYALLPQPYTVTYSTSSNDFTITPTLPKALAQTFTGEASIKVSSMDLTNFKPLTRTRPTYTPTIYALLGLAGGLGCTLTHTVVVPLDVVKTRIQTDPMFITSNDDESSYGKNSKKKNALLAGATTILKKEGIAGLTLGLQATIVGYLWYGISVYPSYTFFKRFLMFQSAALFPSLGIGGNFNEVVSLIAGAMSAVLASIGLTPLEACRIRAVAEPETYAPIGVTGTAAIIASENPSMGWTNLYAGLPSLLTRQVVFGSVKFLAFEKAVDAMFLIAPTDWSIPGSAGSLTISLLAGGFAGCISSVVSQPADCVLTYVAQNSSGGKALGVIEGSRIMVQEGGVGALFRGLGSRCVWAGSIIAGQFLLYDVFKAMFGVDTESLKQVFEIVIDS